MELLLILCGVFLALGLFFVAADLFKLPRLATQKALLSAGRQEKKQARTTDVLLMGWAVKLAPHIHMDEYKHSRLKNTLNAAGLGMTPEEYTAFAAVKAALDDLLTGAPILSGIKFVHWYDEPIGQEEDAIQRDLIDFEDEDEEEDEEDVLTEAEQQAQERQREAQANAAADRLVKSVQTGERATSLSNRYHILLLSGANGRVMVRHYENGSYETLQKNLA